MHMPKSNAFAYICCMLLGTVFIYLGATRRFPETLGNIILVCVGVVAVVVYAMLTVRYIKEKKEQEK